MSYDANNESDSGPVPYKSHLSSSAFGSTGIVRRSGNKRFGLWICSISATLLVVTGVTLILVGAPQGIAVTGTGLAGAVLVAIVVRRQRAAAVKRRVRHPTAKR
jgi:Na+/H+ antiporter NhaD/arsenite permease-like protein